MSKHLEHKEKKSKADYKEVKRNMHMVEMMQQKTKDNVKENFFRPAYGKIGERKE